jgi:DNA-binding winged helix-turn-helix (wHTH) protein
MLCYNYAIIYTEVMAMNKNNKFFKSHIRIILIVVVSLIAALFIYRFLLADIRGSAVYREYSDKVSNKRIVFFLFFAVFVALFSIIIGIFNKRKLTENTKTTDSVKTSDELDFGDLRINHSTYRVFVDDTEIILPRKEFELLFFLASNKDIVFSKEKIYDKLWGEDMYGDISTVAVHIKRLREKIEKKPSEPIHVQTVRGIGYKFVP